MTVLRTAMAPVRFVKKHKVAVAVVATSAIWLYINNAALTQHNEFLKDHDLYETFHALTEEI